MYYSSMHEDWKILSQAKISRKVKDAFSLGRENPYNTHSHTKKLPFVPVRILCKETAGFLPQVIK